MAAIHETERYRVVYSTGGHFYTSAQTPAEYILDPIFIQFMVLSIFLFSSLMLALEVPLLPQVILFGAGIVSTFFWMAIALSIYIAIIKAFGGSTIYTPVLLLPMQVMNTFMMDYVLRMFETSYVDGFDNVWNISLRTFIVIVSLDIIHGKFVAPQHGKFVDPNAQDLPAPGAPSQSLATQAHAPYSASSAVPLQSRSDIAADHPSASYRKNEGFNEPATPAASAPESPKASGMVQIGNQSFDLASTRFIRSEDHYLLVQQNDQSTMVRGKLRDVSATIDVSWGLQINRSVWVAFSAIETVNDPASGPMEIIMTDGNLFRVSEARRVFFNHSYEQFKSA